MVDRSPATLQHWKGEYYNEVDSYKLHSKVRIMQRYHDDGNVLYNTQYNSSLNSTFHPRHGKHCVMLDVINLVNPSLLSVACNEAFTVGFVCEMRNMGETFLMSKTQEFSSVSRECDDRLFFFVNQCLSFGYQSIKKHSQLRTLTQIHYNTNKNMFLKLFDILKMYRRQAHIFKFAVDNNFSYCLYIMRENSRIIELQSKWTSHVMTCDKKYGDVLYHMSSFLVSTSSTKCPVSQYHCLDKTCILELYLCDGNKQCSNGDDELNCHCFLPNNVVNNATYCLYECQKPDCRCDTHYFQCIKGGCIPFSFVCDGIPQCPYDESDEFCNRSSFQRQVWTDDSKVLFSCNRSNTFVALTKVNDLISDCPNQEDEKELKKLFDFGANNRIRCMEQQMLSCLSGHSSCFHLDQLCTYDRDTEGYLKYCRNGAHLRYCMDISCSRKYKCSNSYCIPHRLVCDGIWDCQEGKDEEGCYNMICPGKYRCNNRLICIHISNICDFTGDCPNGDDELLCDIRDCPLKCTCLGYSLECKRGTELTINLIYKSAKHLAIHDTKAVEDKFFLCDFPFLIYLNMSNNGISNILNTFFHNCKTSSNLKHMDMSFNQIKIIINDNMQLLENLETLSLRSNIIQEIKRNAFKCLKHIQLLDISNNEILSLNSFIFNAISDSLKFLNIKFNPLLHIDTGIAFILEGIKISTNDFKLCCILLQEISNCGNYSPYLSSCSHVLENNAYNSLCGSLVSQQ